MLFRCPCRAEYRSICMEIFVQKITEIAAK